MDWTLLPLDELKAEAAAVLQAYLTDLKVDYADFKDDIKDIGASMITYGVKAATGDVEAKEIFHLVQHRASLIYARILDRQAQHIADKWETAVQIGMKLAASLIKALLV